MAELATQTGTLDVAIPLDQMIDASIIGGFDTRIIDVKLGGDTFELRCIGASGVLAALDDALR